MSAPDVGGPAFPLHPKMAEALGCIPSIVDAGMTLRDYFAAKAMQALLTKQGPYGEDTLPAYSEDVQHVDELAEYAYAQADAMLLVRKNIQPGDL